MPKAHKTSRGYQRASFRDRQEKEIKTKISKPDTETVKTVKNPDGTITTTSIFKYE